MKTPAIIPMSQRQEMRLALAGADLDDARQQLSGVSKTAEVLRGPALGKRIAGLSKARRMMESSLLNIKALEAELVVEQKENTPK